MCMGQAVETNRVSAEDASRSLCRLVSRECRVDIAPAELRAMIGTHWSKLAALAHAIHDEQMNRSPPPDYQNQITPGGSYQ